MFIEDVANIAYKLADVAGNNNAEKRNLLGELMHLYARTIAGIILDDIPEDIDAGLSYEMIVLMEKHNIEV